MAASAGFWDLLSFTTGIAPFTKEDIAELQNRGGIDSGMGMGMDSDDYGFGEKEEDQYTQPAADVDDPTWQMLQMAQFDRLHGGGEERKGLDDLSWSPEAAELLKMYKANMAMAKPKVWTKKKFWKHFSNLKLKKLGIASMDAELTKFRRLKELSISQNSITTLQNLPPNLEVCYAFRNCIRDIQSRDPRKEPKLVCLGLGCNELTTPAAAPIPRLFPTLRILDLSFNSLCDLHGLLDQLIQLEHLTHLTLTGNPLSMLPGYLKAVASRLASRKTKLKMLDDLSPRKIMHQAPPPPEPGNALGLDPKKVQIGLQITQFKKTSEVAAMKRSVSKKKGSGSRASSRAKKSRVPSSHSSVMGKDGKPLEGFTIELELAGQTVQAEDLVITTDDGVTGCLDVAVSFDATVALRDAIAVYGLKVTLFACKRKEVPNAPAASGDATPVPDEEKEEGSEAANADGQAPSATPSEPTVEKTKIAQAMVQLDSLMKPHAKDTNLEAHGIATLKQRSRWHALKANMKAGIFGVAAEAAKSLAYDVCVTATLNPAMGKKAGEGDAVEGSEEEDEEFDDEDAQDTSRASARDSSRK